MMTGNLSWVGNNKETYDRTINDLQKSKISLYI